MSDPRPSIEPQRFLEAAARRAARVLGRVPSRLIVVSTALQRLYLFEREQCVAEYPVSTAKRGVGGADGSERTPPGVHRVAERIGGGEPRGAVFESREPTGECWEGGAEGEDLILSRVVTLDGCEPGVNQGPGCDTRQRYIYLHGTNHETSIGQAASHGCVRLENAAMVDLFDRLDAGDVVVVL